MHLWAIGIKNNRTSIIQTSVFITQPVKALQPLLSPMLSGWAGRWCLPTLFGQVSATVKWKKVKLGRDGLWRRGGCCCAISLSDPSLTFTI